MLQKKEKKYLTSVNHKKPGINYTNLFKKEISKTLKTSKSRMFTKVKKYCNYKKRFST